MTKEINMSQEPIAEPPQEPTTVPLSAAEPTAAESPAAAELPAAAEPPAAAAEVPAAADAPPVAFPAAPAGTPVNAGWAPTQPVVMIPRPRSPWWHFLVVGLIGVVLGGLIWAGISAIADHGHGRFGDNRGQFQRFERGGPGQNGPGRNRPGQIAPGRGGQGPFGGGQNGGTGTNPTTPSQAPSTTTD
jgi:hypothetical protein